MTRKNKILIIEDKSSHRELLRIFLNSMDLDISIDETAMGEDGIEMIQANSYDILLLDLRLPGMSGYTVARHIRGHISKSLPIIVVTASVNKEEIDKLRRLGINDFLYKPIDKIKLKDLILKNTKTDRSNITHVNMITNIGIALGNLWSHFENKPETLLSDLLNDLDISKDILLMCLGWLAREGHIIVEKVVATEDYRIIFNGTIPADI